MRNVPNFKTVVLGVLVACHLSLGAALQAAVPWVLNYQGRLTDSGGKAVTGTYTMKFRLYDASTAGTKLWEESQSVTLLESDNGVFNVILGTTTVLTSVDFNSPMWLSVQVADDSEMTPRQRLTSSAYTMNADQVDGLDSTKFLRTDIDTSTSGKLTITRAGAALVITPSSAPDANTKMVDVQNTAGTTKFSVDYEGDVTVAGDLTVTGTMSGTTSTSGTTNTTWTIDNDNTSGSEPASGAGVVIEGGSGDASILWDATNDELDINQTVNLSAALTVGTDLTVTSGMRIGTGSTPDNLTALADDSLFVEGNVEVDGTLYAAAVNVGGTSVGDISAVGDITSGAAFTATSGADGTTLYFEGSTSDGYEVALTSANPTSDITVTLPATTGTVITTGDSGTVTTTMIADSTITTDDVAADTLTTGDIASGGVATDEIAADTITTGDIASGGVATDEIAADTITSGDIATGAVETTEIAADTITSGDIATGAVETTEIATDTITAGDVAANAIGASELADDAVDEGALKMTNSATDEYILTYESTTGDFEWEAASDLGVTINYNDIGDPSAAGSISFDSGETGTYAFTISADTSQAGSYNLDLTNGINTAGTLNQSALDIDLTNANHTGGTTNLYGIDLAVTDNDNASTSNVYALNIGSGFDRALNTTGTNVFTFGASDVLTLDSAATDTTTTGGVIDVDVDTATDTGKAFDLNVEALLSNNAGTQTVTGLNLVPVQGSTGASGTHVLYGAYIQNLATSGTPSGTNTEYGLRIGTGYDYAAYFESPLALTTGSFTFSDGTLLDLSSINTSGTGEGVLLPQATSCASGTAEGQLCWDTDNDTLYVGNGTTATTISSGGSFGATVDDTELTAEDFGSFTCSGSEDGCTLDASSVATAEISADTITSGDIATGAVETAEIAADTITTGDIASGGVATDEIAADTITAGDIASGGVATDEIAADTITTGDIATGGVETAEIAANTITFADISDSSALDADTTFTAADGIQLTLTPTHTSGDTNFFTIDANQTDDITATDDFDALRLDLTSESGDAGDTFDGIVVVWEEGTANTIMDSALKINNAETTASTLTDAIVVTSSGVDGGVVDAIDVSATNITNAINVGANPIVTGNVAGTIGDAATDSWTFTTDGTGTGEIVLPGSAIDTDEIAADTITTGDIASGGVATDEIAADTITSGDIATGAVESAEIATDTITAGDVDETGAFSWGGLHTFSKVNAAGAGATAVVLSGTVGAMNGSDTMAGIQIAYTNADHTGTLNILAGLDVRDITGDAQASEYGMIVGEGWDYGLWTSSPLYVNSTASIASTMTIAQGITLNDGALLDLDAINVSSTSEGLLLPQATSCASGTAEGQLCWDTDNDTLYVGNGTTATTISSGGSFGATVDDTELTAEDFGSFTCSGSEDGCTLDASSVATAEISADTITSGDIATGAVETAEIAADTITTGDIASGGVATDEIAADTITAGDIATDGVGAAEIAADALLYNEIGDAGAAGSISFDSGETGTYAFTVSADTSQTGSYNLDHTTGINTTGTLNQTALDIDLTNANHSGGTTNLYGIDLQVTDNDNASTSNVYALNIGSGFDRAISANSPVVIAGGANPTQALDVSSTLTGTGNQYAIKGVMENTSGVVGQTHGSPIGVYGEGKISNTSAGLLASPVLSYGVYGAGIGNVGDLDGDVAADMFEVDAVVGKVTNSGLGKLTSGYTFRALAPANSGGGSITNTYGVHIADQGLSGTTTTYGLYIADQTGSTTVYAAYIAGGPVTLADGAVLDLDAINVSSATEGLLLPQATSCASGTAEGQICWDTDNDTLYVGSGSSAGSVGAGRLFLQGGSDTSIANTFYCGVANADNCSTTEDGAQGLVSSALTCTTIYAQVDAAPGAGNSWAVALRDDGSNTTLDCTISDTATSCNGTDAGVSVAAGSVVNFSFTESGTATSSAGQTASATCSF